MESVSLEVVRSLLLQGKTYREISLELQELYPHISRGLSPRSIRRYVKANSLLELANQDVLEAVDASVNEVVVIVNHRGASSQ